MSDNSEQINIVINATDNASRTIALVGQAFSMITNAVGSTIKAYTDYGAQVKELSSYTGQSSEATSRLLEVADKAGVSYQTLSQAAKAQVMDAISTQKETAKLNDEITKLSATMQTAKGNTSDNAAKLADLKAQLAAVGTSATLSVDSLARLSDEYTKIQDPVQKAIFLQDNFKRSGEDLARIMALGGDTIRQYAADTAASKIIDDQKAAALEKTRMAQVDFNDAMEATKFGVAQQLLDIFNALPAPLKNVVQIMGVVGQSGMLQQFSQMAILVVELSRAGGISAVFTSIGATASGAAVGLWAMLAPLIPLAVAIAALIALINSPAFPKAVTAAQQLFSLGMGAAISIGTGKSASEGAAFVYNQIGGKAGGGGVNAGQAYVVGERGPELLTMGNQGGYITPNGGGGLTVNFTYAPAVSLATRGEAENIITPAILSILHKNGYRANG